MECPICFELKKKYNLYTCCKQIICDDCHKQLKRCPFCMNDEEDDRDEMREQADIIHNTFIQVQEERAENKKKIVLCCIVGFAITFYISYVVPN